MEAGGEALDPGQRQLGEGRDLAQEHDRRLVDDGQVLDPADPAVDDEGQDRQERPGDDERAPDPEGREEDGRQEAAGDHARAGDAFEDREDRGPLVVRHAALEDREDGDVEDRVGDADHDHRREGDRREGEEPDHGDRERPSRRA